MLNKHESGYRRNRQSAAKRVDQIHKDTLTYICFVLFFFFSLTDSNHQQPESSYT